jgi:hypothetical protein
VNLSAEGLERLNPLPSRRDGGISWINIIRFCHATDAFQQKKLPVMAPPKNNLLLASGIIDYKRQF